jgi:hypothetical protein
VSDCSDEVYVLGTEPVDFPEVDDVNLTELWHPKSVRIRSARGTC